MLLLLQNPEATNRMDIFEGYLGTVLCEMKQTQEALLPFQRALMHLEANPRLRTHDRMITALCNLGSIHYRLNEWKIARDFYESALELSVQTKGIHHPESVQISSFIARTDTHLQVQS
eukprot:TRINITY_DN4348_c0_g1_i3.p1 TRINITY_DN4348_c0_g1~~TRINITY_DN4348_c0_g1_i3.p1  ORF type:complete len:118 (+),score=29.51 TRINITY_DN4348_c0_g1_i3:110-463(+)